MQEEKKMNTVDGHEIKNGDTVFNQHGETLIVDELLFARNENDNDKLLVIPQYEVDNFYADGSIGYHREIPIYAEFEAAPKVMKCNEVFKVAPTAKVCNSIIIKQNELKSVAELIGMAKIMKANYEKELEQEKNHLKEIKEQVSKAKSEAKELMESTMRMLA